MPGLPSDYRPVAQSATDMPGTLMTDNAFVSPTPEKIIMMFILDLLCRLNRCYRQCIQQEVSCDNPECASVNGRMRVSTFFSHR